jgi:quercetin dioxygenase-like cupin family protein
MNRFSFFVVFVSVVLFSGQARQPVAPRQQQPQPQRPPTPQVQPATPPAEEMPSLYYLPGDIKYPERPPGATREVTLFGDPSADGLYVRRTLIPKGTKTTPHVHPDPRMVTVLSGVCYYGRGEYGEELQFDEKRILPMPSGSFFTEPAGIPHFIWAKDGDVIVQTIAIGPSGTQISPDRRSSAVSGRP